jgi:hypothetical protein
MIFNAIDINSLVLSFFQENARLSIVTENCVEYGDYQTNQQLAQSICNYLSNKRINPQILIEPTCGKGNFILSAIQTFKNLEQVFVLEYFLKNPQTNKPEIRLYHYNIFDFDFQQINSRELLVIGNSLFD